MGISNIVYLSEIATLVIALVIGIIIIKVKHKKGILKFIGIASAIFLTLFAISFILEKPEMKIPKIADVEVKTEANLKKPKTIYHFFDVTDKVQITGNVDYNKIGEYDVKFEIETWIGKYIKTEKINIVDTKAPEITLEGRRRI